MQKNHKNNKANNSRHRQSDDENFIWIGGKNPCQLALKNKNRKIFEILTTKNNFEDIKLFLNQNSLTHFIKIIKIVDNLYISNVLGRDLLHQGIALKATKLNFKNQFQLLEELNTIDGNNLPKILILDQITDPHNVGAIIRSAVAFGFKKIIFCEFNSAKESPTMIKASAGNVEFAEIYIATNLNNLLEKLKKLGYWCVGLAGEGKDSQQKLTEFKNIALIVGSEGDGIRNLVKKNCDFLVRIDICEEVESLNVSVATAIALNEIYRTKYV